MTQRGEPIQGFLPTVFDRLADPDAGLAGRRPGFSLEQLLAALRRDLENLLNTRQMVDERVEDFPELRRSVFNYGLPDVASRSAASAAQREALGRMVEQVIGEYEPRLRGVRAKPLEPLEGDLQTVRFEIEARLEMEPNPQVAFATVLELTGHASVRKKA
ncbi:MAG: type VI secretion system baseplate subunit TssE [Planctomycetia bacterium]